jgi:hypothetical protein
VPSITQKNSSLRFERKVPSPRANADASSCSMRIVPVCERAAVEPVGSRAPAGAPALLLLVPRLLLLPRLLLPPLLLLLPLL